MKFNNNLPIYLQIMDLIKLDIVKGDYKTGDKLLSVRDLSSKFKVNPNTIQRAYQELEMEEIVETRRGMGTFVTEDKEIIEDLKNNMAINIVNNFIKDIHSIGLDKKDLIKILEMIGPNGVNKDEIEDIIINNKEE